jgi:hypothetical protein
MMIIILTIYTHDYKVDNYMLPADNTMTNNFLCQQ